jgi:hypothetical protein
VEAPSCLIQSKGKDHQERAQTLEAVQRPVFVQHSQAVVREVAHQTAAGNQKRFVQEHRRSLQRHDFK